MTETEVLRSMVQSFRIMELQTLMIFAGKSKLGRKTDLQNRALELISGNDEKVMRKVRELSGEMYKAIGGASSVNPYSANYVGGNVNQPVPETPPPTAPATPASEKPVEVAQNGDSEDLPIKKPKDKNKDKLKKQKKKDKKSRSLSKKKSTKSPSKSKSAKAVEKPKNKATPPAPAPVATQRDSGQRRSRRTAAIAATAALAAQAAQDKNIGAVSSSSDQDDDDDDDDDDESSSDESSSSSESEAEEATEQQQVQPKKRGRQTRNKPPVSTATAAAPTPPTTATASVPSTMANPPFSSVRSASALAASYAHLMGRGSYMAHNLVGPQGNPQAMTKQAGSIPNFCGFTYRTNTSSSKANQSGGGQSHIPPAAAANSQYHMASYANGSKSHLVYPTFADVKLRKLPFYDVMATLLKPSSLQPTGSARFQEQTFSFHLTPQQVSEIEQSNYRDAMGRPEYKKQIQLRFSLLETSCEQNDNFPSSVSVKVNGRLQPLPNPIPTNKPGVEPKRPPKAINVTGLCKLSSTVANYINVSWTVEVGRGYTLSVYFVEKLSSSDLLSRLKAKGQRHPDYTRAVIKDKLNDTDSEISTTSCKVTLACPLGKMRMRLPCRSSACDHLQCFDASNYLMMNEKRDKWMCPVCNKVASYDTLMLDGYFTEMLSSRRLPDDEHEIVLHADASWDPLPPKIPDHLDPKHFQQEKPKPAENNVETLSLTDDDSDQPPLRHAPPPSKSRSKNNEDVECVTLDSSSGGEDNEDEIVPPLSKRGRFIAPELLDGGSRDSPSSSINTITPASSTATLQSSSPTESAPNNLEDAHRNLVALAAAAASGEDERRAREIEQLVRLSSANNGDNPPLICLDDDD